MRPASRVFETAVLNYSNLLLIIKMSSDGIGKIECCNSTRPREMVLQAAVRWTEKKIIQIKLDTVSNYVELKLVFQCKVKMLLSF